MTMMIPEELREKEKDEIPRTVVPKGKKKTGTRKLRPTVEELMKLFNGHATEEESERLKEFDVPLNFPIDVCNDNGVDITRYRRKCIGRCSKHFPAEGKFNRLCPTCTPPKYSK